MMQDNFKEREKALGRPPPKWLMLRDSLWAKELDYRYNTSKSSAPFMIGGHQFQVQRVPNGRAGYWYNLKCDGKHTTIHNALWLLWEKDPNRVDRKFPKESEMSYSAEEIKTINEAMARGERQRHMSAISKGKKKPRWFYRGDASMENGGYFYNLDNWPDFVDVWRVTPCSDAGGPDNQFWVEEYTLCTDPRHSQHKQWVQDALKCCGWIEDGAYEKASAAQRRHMLVDALISHGAGLDRVHGFTLQVGAKPDELSSGRAGWDPVRIHHIIPAGLDLKTWVRNRISEGNLDMLGNQA